MSTATRKVLESATRALMGQPPGFTPGPYNVDQRGEHFFAVLGRNPDADKPLTSYSGAKLTVCTTDSREEAERIALCLGVHNEMLDLLTEYQQTPPSQRETPEWHTPWYIRLSAAIEAAS